MVLKVAIFHSSLPSCLRKIGGVEAAVHRLAETLSQDQEIDVTVFSCDEAPKYASYRHKRIFASAMHSKLARLIALPIFLNFVNFDGFDLVHTHGDDWFWFWRRVPTVRTMHGSALREAQTATTRKRRILQYLIYPLEHISVALASRTVAVGEDTKRIYRCDEIIGNGVNLSRFKPREKAPYPLLIFIGTWNGRKRGCFTFDIFKELVLPRFPGAMLHMVSDWAEPHPHVIWHKHLDDEALANLLAQAWVFCYPSVYEGFGIPYIEAMASGTPIVTTRNAGAYEVLSDGKFGLICADEDFGKQVVEILVDEKLRRPLAQLGIERAKSFSAEAVAARYQQIYRKLVELC